MSLTGSETVGAIGIGLAGSFWVALAFLLVVTGALGVAGPVKQAYMHQIVPSEHRASVISFNSLVGNAGGVGAQGGLGYLARARSIGEGYVVGGLATILALPMLFLLRGLREDADEIVGAHAGRRRVRRRAYRRSGASTRRLARRSAREVSIRHASSEEPQYGSPSKM